MQKDWKIGTEIFVYHFFAKQKIKYAHPSKFRIGIFGIMIFLFVACQKEDIKIIGPFSNVSSERNMIVVISDLHLGADLAYAEINQNLKPLEHFLDQISQSPNVRGLVIAGDFLDEWFIPGNIDTYNGKDQKDFVKRVAIANKGVVDAFNRIIKAGKITVTYVPGNHDLTITESNVASIMPGIIQARDKQQGLGTYAPTDIPKMAVEHGHRYNFFCAPDPYSNQNIAPGTISPPGYFFTRIAALHVAQNYHPTSYNFPAITPNSAGDASQSLLYVYSKVWEGTLKTLPITNKLDEKVIVTNIDGFTGNYSVNDVLPFQTSAGGVISVNLYKGIQDNWDLRQKNNGVAMLIPTSRAIANSVSATETDDQAINQYFTNPNSNKRLVLFGHSHDPKIVSALNHDGQKSIYANTGTWIDSNPNRKTMTFVVVTLQNIDASSQTLVKLYNFENEIVTEMAKDSLRL